MKRKALLGRKVGMTRILDESGVTIPVTIVELGPCYVTQVKTESTDGYNAVQLGFEQVRQLNSPERGHLRNVPLLKHLREVATDDADTYQVGQRLDVSLFAAGELVDAIGVSKGKGFAGAMKRHNYGGGPRTHGQSDRQRAVGSIGATSTPGRVWKGKTMPGQMGNERVTTLNLSIVKIDAERNLIAIKGAVPGPAGGLVIIRNAVKMA
ncbi:MAG: 50S ribosomal protein L3 [Anaerolineae bacterium]|jgi:large subunit ribosomal protein L3|nr:50S ribosomal protein L3 [Chloroflexota bacterium]